MNLFFVFLFVSESYTKDPHKEKIFYAEILIEFFCFLIASHLLRLVLKRIPWMHLPTQKVIILFIGSVALTGLLAYYSSEFIGQQMGYSLADYEKSVNLTKAQESEATYNLSGTYYLEPIDTTTKDSVAYNNIQNIRKSTGWYRDKKGAWQYEDRRKGRYWWDIIFSFLLIALWLLIYMVWHYIEKEQKDKVDKIMLEKTVKELELKTIKAHINPHFIFNSLNSIRALVDENPSRARKAITELANILRSSMQVDKLETVPLEQELSIVKDYLALEQMRFEERLKVEMDIDEQTLALPVPPMVIQTLAENAIKHGISKYINGGFIRIISRLRNGQHELIVQNSGELNGEGSESGFGIKSTQDRLNYLYQGKASFEIKNENGIVQSFIRMPAEH